MIEKKTFNWVAFWLLGCVTFGIYPIYVWCKMTSINNQIARKYEEDTIMGFIPALLLGCITCGIFSIIWIYKFMKLQIKIAERSGVKPTTDSPFLMLLLSYVPVYSFIMMCSNFNRTVEAN